VRMIEQQIIETCATKLIHTDKSRLNLSLTRRTTNR
jgi:hypothetical protein